jgi:nucleoside-diphosphate-sugar epimerase
MSENIVQPGAKVLVTGANGYIAIWVVKTLLEQGYAVRGTVRSSEKGNHLTSMFKKYGDKFELAVVEDITKVRFFQSYVM